MSLSSGFRVRPSQASSFTYVGVGGVAPHVPSQPSRLKACVPGPWGDIEFHHLYLEASEELVSHFAMPAAVPRWSFQNTTREKVGAALVEAGLPRFQVAALLTRSLDQYGVVHLHPSVAELESLSPSVRSSIAALLAREELNEFHRDPVFITGGDVAEFFRGTDIPQEIIQWFSRMSYWRGGVLCFSDVQALIAQARSDAEARRFFKLCSRTRTLVARLRLNAATDFSKLKAYWTKGGRRRDVISMLQCVAETPGAEHLDLIHLLPPLPRKLLYSYPPLELAANGRMPDCHWSSLNFFNYEPRQYYLDTRLAASHVIESFEPVGAPFQFGDVLFFLEGPEKRAFHSCVYVADRIVFTKNGENAASPWVLADLGDLEQVYLSAGGGHVQGYRRA